MPAPSPRSERRRRPSPAAPFRLPEAPTRTDVVAKYFRALGDPTRLRILEALRREGELSVGELAAGLGVVQPAISNHLACLRWCGLVATRREHRVAWNRVADERVGAILDLGEALFERDVDRR